MHMTWNWSLFSSSSSLSFMLLMVHLNMFTLSLLCIPCLSLPWATTFEFSSSFVSGLFHCYFIPFYTLNTSFFHILLSHHFSALPQLCPLPLFSRLSSTSQCSSSSFTTSVSQSLLSPYNTIFTLSIASFHISLPTLMPSLNLTTASPPPGISPFSSSPGHLPGSSPSPSPRYLHPHPTPVRTLNPTPTSPLPPPCQWRKQAKP